VKSPESAMKEASKLLISIYTLLINFYDTSAVKTQLTMYSLLVDAVSPATRACTTPETERKVYLDDLFCDLLARTVSSNLGSITYSGFRRIKMRLHHTRAKCLTLPS